MRDEDFIRGNIPMTKSEIRAVSLSKLCLKRDSIMYDIGAGTGSVSVEAALLSSEGRVYAFEEKQEGCELIEKNAEKFGVRNITVIHQTAPEAFVGCPSPDCAFIGGSGGKLDEIIGALYEMNPQVRIVLNAVTLETLKNADEAFSRRKIPAEVVCVNVSRAQEMGNYHLMKAQNPVFIITAMSKGEKEYGH